MHRAQPSRVPRDSRDSHDSAGADGLPRLDGGSERAGRRWHALNAFVAWFGLAVSFTLAALGTYPATVRIPTRYGFGVPDGAAGAGDRLADWFCYFTIWSNVTVLVVCTLLATGVVRGAARDTRWFRALRLDTLLMMTVTALVYAVMLAPTAEQRGWENLSNSLLHQVTPLVTVVVWAFLDRGRRFRWTDVLGALVVPMCWVAVMFARGAVIGRYPYPFVDVAVLGYGTALVNVGVILVFGLTVASAFVGLDRLPGRRTVRA